MALKTYGSMGVDWENRIDFDRLRRERLERAKAPLAKSEMGALLRFDMNNARYQTAPRIGTAAENPPAAGSDVDGDGGRGKGRAKNKSETRKPRTTQGAARDRRGRAAET